MLSNDIIKKIENLVSQKPRSIQEIANSIGKNWRTADRYIEEIEKNFGTISTRVFREGTRGALKIVYWSSIEKAKSSAFQEQLEKDILSGRGKEDFSPFDIFQHVEKNKSVIALTGKDENSLGLKNLKEILLQAKRQIIIFSGNLSFINFGHNHEEIIKVFEELNRKNVSIKVISRVDISGKENIEKLLSINSKYGKEIIEIRHRDQPIRAIIVDNNFFNIKEIKEPTGREMELNKKVFLFYTIKDKEWVEWLSRVFWKMFSSSISAERRLEEIEKIKIR